MLYQILNQMILITLSLVITIFLILNIYFQTKKSKEYHNDTRWRMIQSKAKSIALTYVNVVTVVIGGASITTSFVFGEKLQMPVGRVLSVIFSLLLIESMIEYLALRYFDKRL